MQQLSNAQPTPYRAESAHVVGANSKDGDSAEKSTLERGGHPQALAEHDDDGVLAGLEEEEGEVRAETGEAADEFVQPIDINEAYTDDEDETASEAASAVGVAHLVDPDRADSEGALGVADPEGSEQTGAAAAAARPEITDPREYARLYRACSSTLRAGLVVVHATPPRDALA